MNDVNLKTPPKSQKNSNVNDEFDDYSLNDIGFKR